MSGPEKVGEQDPERLNSPVLEENDDVEFDLSESEDGVSTCFFNDRSYTDGSFVRSGTALLRCEHGVWVVTGSSDPDNP